MAYRSQRQFKQQQRDAYADWLCQKDREQDEYFDPVEAPSYDEREAEHSDHGYRIRDEAAGVGVGEWHGR